MRGELGVRETRAAPLAFTICFTSWGLVAPLAKHLHTPSGCVWAPAGRLTATAIATAATTAAPAGSSRRGAVRWVAQA